METRSSQGTLHTRLGTRCPSPTRPFLHPQGFAGTSATRRRLGRARSQRAQTRVPPETPKGARPRAHAFRPNLPLRVGANERHWRRLAGPPRKPPFLPAKGLQPPAAAPSPRLWPEARSNSLRSRPARGALALPSVFPSLTSASPQAGSRPLAPTPTRAGGQGRAAAGREAPHPAGSPHLTLKIA